MLMLRQRSVCVLRTVMLWWERNEWAGVKREAKMDFDYWMCLEVLSREVCRCITHSVACVKTRGSISILLLSQPLSH